MVRYVDPLIFTNTFIDANILDEVSDGEGEAVKQIIKLFHDGEITLLLPYSAQEEIGHPNTPAYVIALFQIDIADLPDFFRQVDQ